MRCAVALFLTLLLAGGACSGPKASTSGTDEAARGIMQRLVAASPTDWDRALTMALDLGPSAAPDLVAALQANPDGLGWEPALAALGELGSEQGRSLLRSRIAERSEQSAAAALALGRLGMQRRSRSAGSEQAAADDVQLLVEAAQDRLADPTLRAASAASLVRLGALAPARRLVRGILLAGTPHGRALEAELGLPHRPRWAYERHLLQLALRDAAGQDFGLDTDAPWDRLLATADRVDRWLGRP